MYICTHTYMYTHTYTYVCIYTHIHICTHIHTYTHICIYTHYTHIHDPGLDPWFGTIPWWKERQPTPVFLPGESHGWRSLAGYRPRECKESETTERLTLSHFQRPHTPWPAKLLCTRKQAFKRVMNLASKGSEQTAGGKHSCADSALVLMRVQPASAGEEMASCKGRNNPFLQPWTLGVILNIQRGSQAIFLSVFIWSRCLLLMNTLALKRIIKWDSTRFQLEFS